MEVWYIASEVKHRHYTFRRMHFRIHFNEIFLNMGKSQVMENSESWVQILDWKGAFSTLQYYVSLSFRPRSRYGEVLMAKNS